MRKLRWVGISHSYCRHMYQHDPFLHLTSSSWTSHPCALPGALILLVSFLCLSISLSHLCLFLCLGVIVILVSVLYHMFSLLWLFDGGWWMFVSLMFVLLIRSLLWLVCLWLSSRISPLNPSFTMHTKSWYRRRIWWGRKSQIRYHFVMRAEISRIQN